MTSISVEKILAHGRKTTQKIQHHRPQLPQLRSVLMTIRKSLGKNSIHEGFYKSKALADQK